MRANRVLTYLSVFFPSYLCLPSARNENGGLGMRKLMMLSIAVILGNTALATTEASAHGRWDAGWCHPGWHHAERHRNGWRHSGWLREQGHHCASHYLNVGRYGRHLVTCCW